jgi:hypothetical protein
VAFVAGIKLLNLNRLFCAESRLLQFDFHVVPQIRPTTPIIGACPYSAAEERLKNSAANSAAAEYFSEYFEWIMKSAATETGPALRERGVTEAIVGGAFVWIHQNIVRFA